MKVERCRDWQLQPVVAFGNGRLKLQRKSFNLRVTTVIDTISDSTIFDQLMIQDDSVYVLGLTSSFTAKTLSDIVLSFETGMPTGSQKHQSIQSSVKSPDDVSIIVSGNKHVTYVWLEDGVVKTFSRAESSGKPRTIQSKSSTGSYVKIIKTEEASQLGYVFVQRADGAADILDSRDGKFRIARWFDARVSRPVAWLRNTDFDSPMQTRSMDPSTAP